MSPLDPLLYPRAFLAGGWHARIAPLLGDPDATAHAIDVWLATQAAVPTALRRPSDPFSLYDGGRASEPRLRLLSVLPVQSGGSVDKKGLERILRDPHAAHLEGFALSEKGAASVLAKGLTDSPVARIRTLEATDAGLPTNDELSALLAHPKLASLERLVLSGAALKERFLMIARAPAVGSLRTLVLAGCEKLPRKDFDTFAAAGWPRLESLHIGSSTWEPKDGARDGLWKAPWTRNLKSLSLSGASPTEVPLLVASGVLPSLQTFSISTTKVTRDERRPLWSHLRSCAVLSTSGPFDLASAEALVASGCVPGLEVTWVDFTPEARAALVAAGFDPQARKADRVTARGFSIDT